MCIRDRSLANRDHPDTSIAYFRVYWRYVEPERGKYDWDLLDTALKTAHNLSLIHIFCGWAIPTGNGRPAASRNTLERMRGSFSQTNGTPSKWRYRAMS